MADKILVDGMIVRNPNPKAPTWVKASISFNVGKFIEFADQHQKNGWLNVDMNLSQKGELYASLNEFTPKAHTDAGTAEQPPIINLDGDDEVPF
jgi:hypothetical protein